MFSRFKGWVAATVAFLGSSTVAVAALPTGLDTTVTGLQTDALAAIDLAIPVILVVLTTFVVIKMIKRALNKI
jgi:hypothetical protein